MIKLTLILISIAVGLATYRFLVLGGPLRAGVYPDRHQSAYKLPWTPGDSYFCFQGNHGILSHHGRGQFAWDFLMPEGTPILAARGGTVVSVIDHYEGKGRDKPNNEIFIDHGDGTLARYAHIKKDGSKVRVGESVERGQVVALSGEVGRSLGPHLHFEVVDQNKVSIPIAFQDVEEHEGVPRTSFFYRSGN